ncbi:DUF397 domain-containing protein [Amycolatopsis sp. VC5-11]|uniref:DUF397 domain-containing protein n=1 Tax=Amycolatopsis sp. VC5-11 TaxID=3120156 RepID=UPI00300AB857
MTDEKAMLRQQLDADEVQWEAVAGTGGEIEFGRVSDQSGRSFYLLRGRNGDVLVFTESEWGAWLRGVRDGEFDLPGSAGV